MRSTTMLLVAVLLFCAANSSHAFDGQRKGFIVGFGAGLGSTHISSQGLYGKASIWRSAPALGFRIGYAPNNHSGIFFGVKSVLTYWDLIKQKYSEYGDAMNDGGIKGVFATIGAPFILPLLWMSGSHSTFSFLGYTHYFTEQAPGYFVEGTVGIGIVPDEFRQETFGGMGLSVAGGYEFKSHLSLRLDMMYGSASETYSDEFYFAYKEKSSALSFMLTVNVLAY